MKLSKPMQKKMQDYKHKLSAEVREQKEIQSKPLTLEQLEVFMKLAKQLNDIGEF